MLYVLEKCFYSNLIVMDYQREKEVKQVLDKVKSFENMIDEPMYNTRPEEEFKIHIKVDDSVKHGLFIPSKIYPGQWRASYQTFRAMKKDIFSLGNSIDELVDPYECQSCKTDLDKQFWYFCPYCGEKFLV